ncbi:unnamed protein product, partial [Mesorhabditis belari]|uniref:MADF domain-containing protein n=1 Tax=Mesorhabditis belari TaxID=2138241 RepID=A0AAF3ED25_9BILA
MAWTDNSRGTLIEQVKERPVLWDRAMQSDPNARVLRHEAIREIVDILNDTYFPHLSKQQYTPDEVRSQWKNLKDTYKRKQRWLSEGKYSRDPAEEPTWKFFRLLRFLEKGKEEGPLREDGASSNEAPDGSQMQIVSKFEAPSSSSWNEEANSIDFLLKAAEVVQRPPTEKFMNQPPPIHPVVPTTMPRDTSPPPKRARTSIMMGSGPSTSLQNTVPLQTTQLAQDDFGHFGQFIGVTLRRIAAEGFRVEALRLQKKISDLIFDTQLRALEATER